MQGNVEIVKTLLSDPLEERPHPSLNEGDAAGNTPLHYSVMYGKAKVFEFLMTSYQNEGLEVHKPNSVSLNLTGLIYNFLLILYTACLIKRITTIYIVNED